MAEKIMITGKAEIKVTASQLRSKAELQEKSRGPKQIGQLKWGVSVSFGHITRDDLNKRVDAAEKILQTGKIPKTGEAEIAGLRKKIKALEAEVKSLTPTPSKEKKPAENKTATKTKATTAKKGTKK